MGIIGDEIEFGQLTSNGQVLEPGDRRPAVVELLRKVVTSFTLKHVAFVVLCVGFVHTDNIILPKVLCQKYLYRNVVKLADMRSLQLYVN